MLKIGIACFVLCSLSGLALSANIFHSKYRENEVASWNLGSWIHPHTNTSIQFDLKFFTPVKPGAYPVIFFLTGLNGFAANFFYTNFVTDLALKANSIVIVFDGLEFSKFPDPEEQIFQDTLDWTTQNINGLFNMDATPASIKGKVFPDLKTYGASLMGHSAAGHTIVSYLVKQCGLIKTLILLDPVDGYDPFGIVKQFVTNPPNMLPFVIPTLLASTGLSAQPVIPIFPPCAPVNLSNTRFYDVLSGPTWRVDFADYGHADVLTDLGREFAQLICKPCQKNCEIELYRVNLANIISFFLKAVQRQDPNYLNTIENPEKSPLIDSFIKTSGVHKYQGFDVLKTGPFCTNNKTNKSF